MIRTLLLVGLLASAAHAQGGAVEIGTTPTLPVAGQPADAYVRFLETRPSRVSLFVRPTGTTAYREVPALETEPGRFSASVGDVPPQGLETFAEYDLDGQTFTEPDVDPETHPFRIPAFHPRAASTQLLPARQYRMISVPLVLGATGELPLGSDDPAVVLADDFGAPDPAAWRLLRFDQDLNLPRDFATDPEGVGPFRPGHGYWLITASGGRFDAEQGLSAGVTFDGVPFRSSVFVELQSGWNQIGNPFLFPLAWAGVGQSGDVQDPVAFRGGFLPAQTVLEPWEGYFVFNAGGPTTLVFDALPVEPGGGEAQSPEETLLHRAGPGGSLVTVAATRDGETDLVYLVTGGASLRKPPAVDGGLRLSAVADGAEQAAAVGDGVWTLALRTPGETTLSFRALGTDASVRLDDLDAGTEIAVVGGRAVVPAGPPVRHLRVRLGGASSAAPALGRPYPNPARGALTVPLALPAAGHVRADVVDPLGRVVRVLHDGPLDAGDHALGWDTRAGDGTAVAPGVYLVRLTTAAGAVVVRATVLR